MGEEEQLKKELTALLEENSRLRLEILGLNQFQGSTVAHARERIRDINNERLNALEKADRLESEVKRYREALKQCKSWHLADALRFGSDRERKTWQEQMDVIDSALSEGGSE